MHFFTELKLCIFIFMNLLKLFSTSYKHIHTGLNFSMKKQDSCNQPNQNYLSHIIHKFIFSFITTTIIHTIAVNKYATKPQIVTTFSFSCNYVMDILYTLKVKPNLSVVMTRMQKLQFFTFSYLITACNCH